MHVTGVLSLAVAVGAFSGRLFAQAPTAPAGINDLVRLAADHNRELHAIRQRLPEARGLLRQAGARPAPTLEMSGTTGRPLQTVGEEQFGAGYSHILERGGKRTRRIEVAELGVELARTEFDERLRQVAFEVANLYADAIAQQRKLDRLDQLIRLNRESIRLTEARVQEGDAARLETQLLSVDLSRAEADRLVTAGELEALLVQIKQVVGLKPADQIVLASPQSASTIENINALQQRAATTRADLRLARLLEQQSDAETRLAVSQGIPDVTLSAAYARIFSRFDDQFGLSHTGMPVQLRDRDDVITIGVQIPIGTRGRNRGNVEAASARAAAARIRREHLETRVAAEVGAALRRFTAAQSRVAVLETHVLGQAEKNLDVIRQAYQLGQFRLLDVLAEQRRVVETQLSYVDAQAELEKAMAELERAVGGEIR